MAVDSGYKINALTCVSTTQCTAVDSRGHQVTFDPTKLGSGPAPKIYTIDGTHSLSTLACPTALVCVAGDDNGSLVTFPAAGGAAFKVDQIFPATPNPSPPPATLPPRPVVAVACASVTACVAFDSLGEEITYNAQTFHVTAHVDQTDYPSDPVAALDPGNTVGAVTCLPNGDCVAVDALGAGGGQAFTFSPANPGATTPANTALTDGSTPPKTAGGFLANSLSCPSNTQCDAVDSGGMVWQFDPTTGLDPVALGNPVFTPVTSPVAVSAAASANAISCSSTVACDVADSGGNSIVFNPNAPASQARVALIFGETLTSISCPAENECIAGDNFGDAVRNDFTNPTGTGTFAVIDPGNVAAISCPSTSQCTGVSSKGYADTYNPLASAQVQVGLVDVGHMLTAISCPSATQCTAVDADGNEVTFNPKAPQGANVVRIDTVPNPAAPPPVLGVSLFAVACPSAAQCTAVDANGNEITFNPTAVGHPAVTPIDSAKVPPANTPPALNALACPSATQCTAVDSYGNQVTFNPAAPAKAATQIDGTNPLSGIACISASNCVAVDSAGNALQGDPTGTAAWASTPLAGATGPTAVTCASADLCVAVDSVGNAYPAGFAPVSTAAPALTGKAFVGDTLSVTHGTWTGTSGITYTYQWQDCTGGNCTAISGATSQTYTLASSDLGFTVNCVVTATNELAPTGVNATSNAGTLIAPAVSTTKASVANALVVKASLHSVRKHNGYSTKWNAPSAGKLVIEWFHGKTLVGKSTVNVSKAGKVKVHIKLTKGGKKLLAKSSSVKLKAKGTFTPKQSIAVSVTQTITLK